MEGGASSMFVGRRENKVVMYTAQSICDQNI